MPAHPPSSRRRSPRRLLAPAFAAIALLALAACSDSDDEPADDARPATTEGIRDVDAEAKTAAVEFFEAFASMDAEAALERASGGAALAVAWARDVNAVPEVQGTDFEATATASPTSDISIEDVAEAPDGRYRATGFIELDQRPPGLAPGELPPPPEEGPDAPPTTTPGPPTWYVTDLVFTRDGNRLLVDDFRMDDSPYPVSQLYAVEEDAPVAVVVDETLAGDGTTTTVADEDADDGTAEALAGSVEVTRAHQDLDDTVQYLLHVGDGPMALAGAEFIAGATVAEPASPQAEGEQLELLGNRPDDAEASGPVDDTDTDADSGDRADPGRTVLAVLGDFPGEQGVLRLTFTGPAEGEVVVLDVEVAGFPELTPLPTNTVRELIAASTSTTTTTTTTTTTEVPTSVVPVPVPVPVPQEPSPTPAPPPAPSTTQAPATTAPTSTAPPG